MATLSQILTDSLELMGENSGEPNVQKYSPKLLPFINEAIADLGDTIRLYHEESATVASGIVDLSTLTKKVKRVISITRDNIEYKFYGGPTRMQIRLYNVADGAVTVRYRYLPAFLSSESDEPIDLPEEAQILIPNYVAGRDYVTADVGSQNRAAANMTLYRQGKLRLARDMGEYDASRFKHVYE